MKILTKEEESAHYYATLKGGLVGGGTGLGVGTAAIVFASRRYPFFRGLTLPLRAFLVTSAATFGGIVTADHYSHAYERSVNPIDQEYKQRQEQEYERSIEGKSFTERAMDFGRKERYKIVGASWVASMVAAFSLVNRNKYLSGSQKLVQARVYAQFLTLGVLVATAAFEISDQRNETGRYETVKILDPNDPEHKRYIEKRREIDKGDEGDRGDELWKDMIAAEEQRIKEREEDEAKIRKQREKKHAKDGKKQPKHDKHDDHEKKEGDDEAEEKVKNDEKKEKEKKGDDKKEDKKEEKSGDKKDSKK